MRKLIAVVPTLEGMKADSNQDQLAGILSKVGEATVRSLSTVPNLSSREDVYSIVLARDPGLTNSVVGMEETPALLDLETQLLQSRSIEFNYLLLFDHQANGATSIKELRTDFKNRQVDFTRKRGRSAWLWICLSVVVINAWESIRVTLPLSRAAENGRS